MRPICTGGMDMRPICTGDDGWGLRVAVRAGSGERCAPDSYGGEAGEGRPWGMG